MQPIRAVRIRTGREPIRSHFISQGLRVGDLLFLSGQIAIDDEGNTIGPNNFKLQAEQVFENLGQVLGAGGSNLKNVIKTNIYLAKGVEFDKAREIVNSLRERYFGVPYPVSTMVSVEGLARELMIEIEVIAVATTKQD